MAVARPSKLSPDQWAEIERRLAAGEQASALAREFGVSPASVSVRVTKNSETIRKTAHLLATAQNALAQLPVPQQYAAMNLAEKLRGISVSLCSAAEHGARTAQRLQALAHEHLQQVKAGQRLDGEATEVLRGVHALTRVANDAASIPMSLLANNREAVRALHEGERADLQAVSDEELLRKLQSAGVPVAAVVEVGRGD